MLQKSSTLICQLATVHICNWLKVKSREIMSCPVCWFMHNSRQNKEVSGWLFQPFRLSYKMLEFVLLSVTLLTIVWFPLLPTTFQQQSSDAISTNSLDPLWRARPNLKTFITKFLVDASVNPPLSWNYWDQWQIWAALTVPQQITGWSTKIIGKFVSQTVCLPS